MARRSTAATSLRKVMEAMGMPRELMGRRCQNVLVAGRGCLCGGARVVGAAEHHPARVRPAGGAVRLDLMTQQPGLVRQPRHACRR